MYNDDWWCMFLFFLNLWMILMLQSWAQAKSHHRQDADLISATSFSAFTEDLGLVVGSSTITTCSRQPGIGYGKTDGRRLAVLCSQNAGSLIRERERIFEKYVHSTAGCRQFCSQCSHRGWSRASFFIWPSKDTRPKRLWRSSTVYLGWQDIGFCCEPAFI